jgi:hypothetical protein
LNLARFGLTRDDRHNVVPEGSVDLEEISEAEAQRDPLDVQVIEVPLESEPRTQGTIITFDALELDGDVLTATRGRSRRTSKKYVRKKKNTSKKFVERMKKQFQIVDLDKPIREMKEDELLAHFREDETQAEKRRRQQEDAERRSRRRRRRPNRRSEEYKGPFIDKRKFALNVIWQIYGDIKAGRPPEFVKVSCNIRSFYYFMKTVIRDNKKIFDDSDNIYDHFSRGMKDIVLAGLVSYRDFKIVDDRRSYRLLPPAYGNTNVILLAEKDSFVGRFFELGSRYGVVVQITKGRGSVLMTDTLLTEMFEAGFDMNKQLSILSFCDFDPVGSSIPYHFAAHLRGLGFTNIREFAQYGELTQTKALSGGSKKTISQIRPCLDIVNVHELETKIRNSLRHEMPSSVRDNPSTADWAFITKGVTGTGRNKTYAISSEMLLPYLEAQLSEKILPLLEKPPETFGRKLAYEYLRGAIREYIGARAERGLLDHA